MKTLKKDEAKIMHPSPSLATTAAEVDALEQVLALTSHEPSPHHSDGAELIPAEVQARTRHDADLSPEPLPEEGYIIDDEGLLNAYSIEPPMYIAPPEPTDYTAQRRSLIQGAIVLFLLAVAVWVVISVS